MYRLYHSWLPLHLFTDDTLKQIQMHFDSVMSPEKQKEAFQSSSQTKPEVKKRPVDEQNPEPQIKPSNISHSQPSQEAIKRQKMAADPRLAQHHHSTSTHPPPSQRALSSSPTPVSGAGSPTVHPPLDAQTVEYLLSLNPELGALAADIKIAKEQRIKPPEEIQHMTFILKDRLEQAHQRMIHQNSAPHMGIALHQPPLTALSNSYHMNGPPPPPPPPPSVSTPFGNSFHGLSLPLAGIMLEVEKLNKSNKSQSSAVSLLLYYSRNRLSRLPALFLTFYAISDLMLLIDIC